MVDGQRFELEHPTLSGDTLTGKRGRGAVAVPVAQVRELAVRRANAPRTALLAIGSLAGAAGATLGVACIMFCGMTD